MVILSGAASCLPIAHVRARWLYWNAFSEVFRHRRRGAINFAGCDELFATRDGGAFRGTISRKRRSRGGIGAEPRYQSKLQIPSNTMARKQAKGGPPAVNASGRWRDCARWSSVERINLIYLSFIRPSARATKRQAERLGLRELFSKIVIYEE